MEKTTTSRLLAFCLAGVLLLCWASGIMAASLAATEKPPEHAGAKGVVKKVTLKVAIKPALHGVVEATSDGKDFKPSLWKVKPSSSKSTHNKTNQLKNAFDESTCPDCFGHLSSVRQFCNRGYHYGIEAIVEKRDKRGYVVLVTDVYRNRTGRPMNINKRIHLRYEGKTTPNIHFASCLCPKLSVNNKYVIWGKLKFHSKSRHPYLTLNRVITTNRRDHIMKLAETCPPPVPVPPTPKSVEEGASTGPPRETTESQTDASGSGQSDVTTATATFSSPTSSIKTEV